MTGEPLCAWCGAPASGRVVRGMHANCYRKALRHGAVVVTQRRPRERANDPLDAKVDAIVRRREAA